MRDIEERKLTNKSLIFNKIHDYFKLTKIINNSSSIDYQKKFTFNSNNSLDKYENWIKY